MRRSRPRHGTAEDAELEMTPMIDVTFLLLVFFLCTIRFKTLEGKLAAHLPPDVGGAPHRVERTEPVLVRLDVVEPGTRLGRDGTPRDDDGPFVYGDDRVVRYRIGPLETSDPDHLGARLRELRANDPERGLRIDARTDVAHADVVRVLDLALAARFREIGFAASRP